MLETALRRQVPWRREGGWWPGNCSNDELTKMYRFDDERREHIRCHVRQIIQAVAGRLEHWQRNLIAVVHSPDKVISAAVLAQLEHEHGAVGRPAELAAGVAGVLG